MKKRFPAMILALALCMGLAIPAFAAETEQRPMPKVTLDLPEGFAADEKTDTYQLLHITDGKTEDGKDAFVYAGEPSGETLAVTPIPLGADVTIGHIARLEDGETCSVTINAYSNAEGVYRERIFFWQANTAYNTTDYDLVLLAKEGPYASPELGAAGYTTSVNINNTGTTFTGTGFTSISFDGFRMEGSPDDPEHALTVASTALHHFFGPNTLLRITAQWGDGEPEQLACLLLTGKSVPKPIPFTDVPKGAYYAAPVSWALERNITNGTSETTFSPDQTCTKVQILTFLYRAGYEPLPRGELPVDITGKGLEYADNALCWAAGEGMIDKTFDLDAMCTRADAVSYIWQTFGKPEAEKFHFNDVADDADYADAVSWAVANGVTNGTDLEAGLFSPDEICTRGQIMTFLHRAFVEDARLVVAG